ncbi:hypothetical protein QO010_002766 [Caulobacter ginsengisoli]|uniref:MarR family transcriptional regulator n=1 Tax=Caulobacter ginsengisoli TaxID=400775 RepID=A0ABU0ISK0_9CAUL|nr:hypothetical protein [Caulobacter ginsengisoli]MDQ0464982.1 hypothetical protein [Caulobacter ginsengisoli]
MDPEELDAWRARPGFPAARDAALASLVALFDANRLLLRLLSDRGRLIMLAAALHLDLSADPADPTSGLTVGRLKAIFVSTGLGSATRASAMIALTRWAGYLAPAPTPADRRLQRMVATPRLVEAMRTMWADQIAAVAALEPDLAPLPGRLAQRAVLAAFVAEVTRRYLAGFRFSDVVPELTAALDRNSGLAVLAELALAGAEGHSVSGLARRFGVSRPHVLAILADAQARGLIARDGEGLQGLVVLPALHEALDRFQAANFAFTAACARVALAAVGDFLRDRPAEDNY